MDFCFARTLTEEERSTELGQIIALGNHKLAEDEPNTIARFLAKDVTHGLSMPLKLDIVTLIPGALAQPLGMAKQVTLKSQDLSFLLSQEDCSVKDQIDMDQYNKMIYGWCLSRIIHFVVALQA